MLNLTVNCVDDITILGNGTKLAGATVSIRSYDGSVSMMAKSEVSGIVEFHNIPESFYTISVQALGHDGYSATIESKIPQTVITAFLPLRLISYTWTVTPVPIVEKYTFVLAATFVTQVPAPVVTLLPFNVDLDKLELGAQTTIMYTITNHGLIRADTVTLSLPTNHPFLRFSCVFP